MKSFKYKINGLTYSVEVDTVEDNVAEVSVNGTAYKVELKHKEGTPMIKRPNETPKVTRPVQGHTAPPASAKAPAKAEAKAAPSSGAGSPVQSPLPGVIRTISCKEGDSVTKGQRLLILEAMKMENDIKAHKDGTIASINVKEGDSVQEGATLVTIS